MADRTDKLLKTHKVAQALALFPCHHWKFHCCSNIDAVEILRAMSAPSILIPLSRRVDPNKQQVHKKSTPQRSQDAIVEALKSSPSTSRPSASSKPSNCHRFDIPAANSHNSANNSHAAVDVISELKKRVWQQQHHNDNVFAAANIWMLCRGNTTVALTLSNPAQWINISVALASWIRQLCSNQKHIQVLLLDSKRS